MHINKKRQKGFTIVEIIIVIVIIGILAAISVLAYSGIRKQAIEATLKSDLTNNAKTIETDNQRTKQYPTSAQAANDGRGLQPSGGNVLTYELRSYGFCLSATNAIVNKTFIFRSTTGKIEEGRCSSTVTTLAGDGTPGLVDGTGSAARFYYPYNIAFGATGSLYVADHYNHRIRQVTPAGVVTTLAPTDLSYPGGVAGDGSGTVYVADTNRHRICKISPSGVMTVLAGNGTAGYVDGTGSAARFDRPYGLALDDKGMLYVADFNNNRIRQVSSDGTVTTLAGSGTLGFQDGSSSAARFSNPVGVAVDITGAVYVADYGNQRIRKIVAGSVTTLAGNGTAGYAEGVGSSAKLNYPVGIAVDPRGIVYVGDSENYRVRKITPDGTVSTLAGAGVSGYLDGDDLTARFSGVRGVAVDTNGVVYVADYENHRIRAITPN